ncbi:MAG: cyclic nucleotide-binding domain-containing protein [Mariprofundaceae bacterium]
MGLTDNKLLRVYRNLHKIFPEDLHIARPFIQMLQTKGDTEHARDLAMNMARRMLAKGRPGDSISFLEICKLLEHPDQDEIEAMGTIAQITSDGPMDMETGNGRTFMLIDQLSDHETRDFLNHGHLMEIANGKDIVQQGEVNRNFYLILEGSMQVHMAAKSGHHIDLSNLEPGHFFGEFACVYQLPRSATVTASEDSLVLEFSDLAISQLMQRSPIAGERLMQIIQTRLIHSMSYSHPAMAEFPEADRKWMAEESHLLEFQGDSLITRHGDMSDRCCIIVYGTATAQHPVDGKTNEVLMEAGEMFGDLNSYLSLPPETTVRTNGRCLVCSMPKKVFQSFMNAYGHFEQWIEAHGKARHKKLNAR